MISYSALTSYGKSTLPSVEVWNGNFNITKDPPSGIHTRRIIKVGDDNSLLDWGDDSGSRINEMINVYARGNNPMVSVQYSNHGNIGSGTMGQDSGGGKLPYRIMNDGAFRPPILRQEDLMPLSRMPRSCTSMSSKRCRVDQTKKIKPDVVEYFKEIHRDLRTVSADTKKSFKKEIPLEPPKNINLLINSNVTTKSVVSNTKKLKDTFDQRNIPVLEDTLLVSMDNINQRRTSRQKYIHNDVQLEKNVPNYEVQTTSNLNIRPNKNIYDLAGQMVKLTDNRPKRPVSNFGAHSGGTSVHLNQEKMVQGAVLKKR